MENDKFACYLEKTIAKFIEQIIWEVDFLVYGNKLPLLYLNVNYIE